MEATEAAPKPRDARTVEAILKSMGVDSYDPRVVNQLLELEYRYIADVLRESNAYSEHADKPSIDLEDMRLAIRDKVAVSFTPPPPREVTMRLAAERNAIPLPPIEQRAGIALPPAHFQLTAQNYRVVLNPKKTRSPHVSPKRPRLGSSPFKRPDTNTAGTPDRSPASSRINVPRSVQSPGRMKVDSPGNQKSPARHGALPPAATAGSLSARQISPMKSSPVHRSGTTSKPGTPSAGRVPTNPPSAADPDVIMVDPGNSSKPTAGVFDAMKTPERTTTPGSASVAQPLTRTPPKPTPP